MNLEILVYEDDNQVQVSFSSGEGCDRAKVITMLELAIDASIAMRTELNAQQEQETWKNSLN